MRETAAARLSRLLALVPWLEQHPGVSVPEAAEHFGVTPDELEQDLWLTICCGLPGHGPDQLIDIQFWDDDASIRVIDAQTLDRPLRFSPAEAMSLLVGLRLLTQVPGDHDRAALASATAKLEAAADLAQGSARVADDPAEGTAATLASAIAQGRAVRIVYAGASRDVVTERIVDPGEILRHSGRSYLAAWCRDAGAERTFRLDRVRSVQILDEAARPHTAVASVGPAEGLAVTLRVAPRSRWLLETLDASMEDATSSGEQVATIVVADPEWLIRLVLGQGGGLEVLQPADVRDRVRGAAELLLAAIGEPN